MPDPIRHLPGQVLIEADAEAAYDAAAGLLLQAALAAVEDRGVFHLALSGGSTPQPLYELLVIDPRYREIPWQKTHVWIVDERRVPHDDDRSNFKMIRENLLDYVPTRRGWVHAVPALEQDPAAAYERQLAEAFDQPISSLGESRPRLDFVLLGMGDDAHTASLFPHSPALAEQRCIAVNDGPAVTPPPRVTMTFPLLNAARHLTVLLIGGTKHAALRQVEQQLASAGADPQRMPITGIQPTDGLLTWCLDAAAAGLPDEIELA